MRFSMGVTPRTPTWAWGKSQAPWSIRDLPPGPGGQLADGFINLGCSSELNPGKSLASSGHVFLIYKKCFAYMKE